MRVMMISNIFPPHVRGGYELGLLDVARGFVEAGHDVEVVTSTVVGVLHKTRPAAGVTVREIFSPVLAYESDLCDQLERSATWRTRRTDALGGVLVETVVALRREIESFRPERIWIGNPLGIGPVGVLETALSAGVPVIVHLMDDIDRYLVGYRRPLHWLSRVARLKKSLTAVSCASHVQEMNEVVGAYGQHHVVLNGVDFDAMPAQAMPGQHDGPLRLVYFGQVEPMKGVPHLIDGIERLLTSTPGAALHLDIIGPASLSYAESLQADLVTRGLDRHIALLGRMEKPALMARLATYDAAALLLKLEEPFGYAWLEAAAAGLPVVVTRGRAVDDAFPQPYPLFVGDRTDPGSVADALRWLLAHREALAPLGAALRTHLHERCDTRTAVTPAYLEILHRAASPRVSTDPEALMAAALTVDAYGLAFEADRP